MGIAFIIAVLLAIGLLKLAGLLERPKQPEPQIASLLNPILGMELQEFVVTRTIRPRHYFRFKNPEGEVEEFIVIYDRFDDDLLYSRTLHRRGGDNDFIRLNEQAWWTIPIRYLIDMGQDRARNAAPIEGHFSATVP